jgi:hypothetical protein
VWTPEATKMPSMSGSTPPIPQVGPSMYASTMTASGIDPPHA